jgi:uncharacterized protein (DUF1697 family)
MQDYVCILRGINVSGHKLVKMEDLRKGFESLGFTQVRSYIQSGNILFKAAKEPSEGAIKSMIMGRYGFDVPVILRSPGNLNEIIEKNPFPDENPRLLYVSFLSVPPSEESLKILQKATPEGEFFSYNGGKEIYLYFPNGYGKAKLSNNFLESRLHVTATTRNWNTVNKLYSMSVSS